MTWHPAVFLQNPLPRFESRPPKTNARPMQDRRMTAALRLVPIKSDGIHQSRDPQAYFFTAAASTGERRRAPELQDRGFGEMLQDALKPRRVPTLRPNGLCAASKPSRNAHLVRAAYTHGGSLSRFRPVSH